MRLIIRVFNKDFIERNVNFEQSKTNSILILSEEKKEELVKYREALTLLENKKIELSNSRKNYEKNVEELKKNLSTWAFNVKKSFELIETSNSYYLNYDRTKINGFIKTNTDDLKNASILTVEKVRELKNTIKPNRKPDIAVEQFTLIDTKELLLKIDDLKSVLSQSVFSKQIQRLVDNSHLNTWVERGLELHQQLGGVKCEFCEQIIPKSRIEDLNNHFSQSYKVLIDALKNLDSFIDSVTEKVSISFSEPSEFYEEFQDDYILSKRNHLDSVQKCYDILKVVSNHLENKLNNPFEIFTSQFDQIENVFDLLNNSLKTMQNIVTKHNFKNQKFDEVVKEAQQKLELHFVAEQLLKDDYQALEKEIKTIKSGCDVLEQEVKTGQEVVHSFEIALLNEAVGAEKFNENLTKFLGRGDIRLKFDKELKGYKLIRGKNTTPANNLSEGEKTAIAFVYFISKLRENGNEIDKTIVIIDDPISSFDSNHLFHAYSYLKMECEMSEQLFIFTHNFQYFRLIRDWLIKKNETKWINGAKTEKMKSRFYSIECLNDLDRHSIITNANDTLIKFNSEYHYVFYKLSALRELQNLDIEKAFLIANLSRKLLEAFLTFKFPKGRNDFSQLLEAGCAEHGNREKVYRFINKYSHNQQIDFHDTPIDNLLGEGNNIVEEVFKIVEKLDPVHYAEMIEVSNS